VSTDPEKRRVDQTVFNLKMGESNKSSVNEFSTPEAELKTHFFMARQKDEKMSREQTKREFIEPIDKPGLQREIIFGIRVGQGPENCLWIEKEKRSSKRATKSKNMR
jgi:hypothetical protein